MKEYNGHRSWNAYNVSSWIDNDEHWYNRAIWCLKECDDDVRLAARLFRALTSLRTPDGAEFNQMSVELALRGLLDG
jgi:hypothetical protein